jgi:hypothetical protein
MARRIRGAEGKAEQARTAKKGRQARSPGGFHFPPHPEAGDHPEHHCNDDEVDRDCPDGVEAVAGRIAPPPVEAFQEGIGTIRHLLDEQVAIGRGVRETAGHEQIVPVDHDRSVLPPGHSVSAVEASGAEDLSRDLPQFGVLGKETVVDQVPLRFERHGAWSVVRGEQIPMVHREGAEGVHQNPGEQEQREVHVRAPGEPREHEDTLSQPHEAGSKDPALHIRLYPSGMADPTLPSRALRSRVISAPAHPHRPADERRQPGGHVANQSL